MNSTRGGEGHGESCIQSKMLRIKRDMLRIYQVHTAGNFKSTPYQMGDNLAGDTINVAQNQILLGGRSLLSEK